jgi:replicative superfamily II helicase
MSLIRLSDQLELVSTADFPHGKYPFEKFNQVQSRVFEICDKNCNCVIAAPTSVGKTICAELFMAHEVRTRGGKAIYLAPLRALAKEKIDDWTSPESIFGDLKIAICTGDYRLTESRMRELNEADIIVMTSEMLNSRCRNMDSEKNDFLKDCGTIVVDESHLLTVPGRGDHLEVGLMKFSEVARDPRIVFLSATMPNVDQIADWVGCSLVKKDTYLVKSEYRPCPLDIHYETYEVSESYELTEEYKVAKAVDIVRNYPDDKFLVFVHSKSTGERVNKALQDAKVECEFHNADLVKDKRHEVEKKFKYGKLRVIIATSTLAWGVNLPSRRVVITGVHRGMNEVETYDIFQMAGRAGRPGYDPRGDVYILLPDNNADHHEDRLSSPKDIESQLLSYSGKAEDPHYKTLAFHLVSEIHHGQISTLKDIHHWYGKSLAYFQYNDLEDSIVDQTMDLLMRVGAVKEVEGKYEVTSVGKVSSMMYYSPFDVADLRRNFKFLFGNGLHINDMAVALALGNVDSIRMGFVTRAEKDEMEDFASRVQNAFGGGYLESSIKGAYAYYCLLNGHTLGPFNAMARGLQMDFERLASVLNMLDSMAAKWNKRDFFSNLSLRIAYGVRPELIDLCKVPNVGKVRAERLYAAGIRKPADMLKNPQLVKKILNMKDDKIMEILKSAKSIVSA